MLDLQITIARLCLSREFRNRFIQDPITTLSDVALSEKDRRALVTVDIEAVAGFGEHLLEKRIAIIRKWLPHTFAALDLEMSPKTVAALMVGFTQHVMRDGDEYGGIWMRREAARIASYIEDLVRQNIVQLPPIMDVLKFDLERLRLLTDPLVGAYAMEHAGAAVKVIGAETKLVRPPFVSLARFEYNIALLLELIKARHRIGDLAADQSLVLFVRKSRTAIDTLSVGEGCRALLEICHHPISVDDIGKQMALAFAGLIGGAELRQAIRQEIGRLISMGALTVAES